MAHSAWLQGNALCSCLCLFCVGGGRGGDGKAQSCEASEGVKGVSEYQRDGANTDVGRETVGKGEARKTIWGGRKVRFWNVLVTIKVIEKGKREWRTLHNLTKGVTLKGCQADRDRRGNKI